MRLSQKLTRVLDQKGWRQAELVRRSRINKAKISRIINEDRPATPDELVKLHRALEVPLVWLADDEMEEIPKPEIDDAERRLLDAAAIVGIDVALKRIMAADDAVRMRREGEPLDREVLEDSADPPRKPSGRGRRAGT